MGTRGVVAIGCATQWSGIYNHMDSYPTWLGRKVWKVLSDTLAEDHSLERFVTQVRRSTDFDQVLNGVVCRYCAQHDPIDASQSTIRLADALKSNAFLFYEWVYVVQVETNSLHVLESVRTPLTFIDEIHNDQGADVLEQSLYAPILVTTLSLDEPEPDWEELENMAIALRQQREQEYAQNPNHPDLVMLRMTVPNVKKANRTALRP